MISDKTVGILTRMREKCEEIRQRDISAEECVEKLDVLADIIDMLMTASSIEQRAIMAKECGDACKGMVEAVEAMRDNMNKDKETVD